MWINNPQHPRGMWDALKCDLDPAKHANGAVCKKPSTTCK